jgi:hypothetical protein
MKLSELVDMIETEQDLDDRIRDAIAAWIKPNRWGDTALKMVVRSFGAGSLRKSAKALGVSPTHLSQCCTGKVVPSRKLMLRLHEVYGTGPAKRKGRR